MIFPPSYLKLPSPETGTVYHISIASPDPSRNPGPWRTILFLDGDDQFAGALDAYRGLWARGQEQPLLLVGVGYGAGYKKPGNRRVRDFTPRPAEDEPDSGGAEAFHAFLSGTLWRRLSDLYPVDEDDPGIAGHSLGAMFVLHAMFRPDPFFRRGLAVAPSLWWDQRATLKAIADFRAGHGVLGGKLFLGLGESDTESMRHDFTELETLLREKPFEDLRVTIERFPGRGHFNVVPVSYTSGLRALYGRVTIPAS
jgi:uncharacterized protein